MRRLLYNGFMTMIANRMSPSEKHHGKPVNGLTWHLLIVSALSAVVFWTVGCGSPQPVAFFFSDENNFPVTNIVAETYCSASRISRVFNPVGNFYHPISLLRTDTPDENGKITYENLKDGAIIYMTAPKFVEIRYVLNSRTNEIKRTSVQVGKGDAKFRFYMNKGCIRYEEK